MEKHNWFAVTLTVIGLAAGSGCISGSGQLQEQQIISQRLESLEQQQAALTRENANAQQKLVADTNIRLDNLERELKLLSEAVEDSITRPEEIPTADKLELEKVITRLEERLQKLEKGAQPQADNAVQPTSSSPLTTPAPPTPLQPQAPGAREKALYDDALAELKRGNDQTAKEKFNNFIASFPDGSYAVNAQFWIGECFYKAKDYAEAIIKYDDIIAKHPDHPKAPSALLKQGFSFIQLGDPTDGKLILEKVIANYPESDQAEIARRKLATLK
ncbi:MAG: tol-pal system protein YbgF [Deltaproteobacteria bacterium]|nr:tol-pal system protein YbgF [Deltaproteobacteria bacterium]